MGQIDRKDWIAILIAKPMREGDTAFSNFDHQYTLTENQVKESGGYHQHSAIEYCGFIWYDMNKKKFYNEIMRYHEAVSIIEGDTLKEAVEGAIDLFGYK